MFYRHVFFAVCFCMVFACGDNPIVSKGLPIVLNGTNAGRFLGHPGCVVSVTNVGERGIRATFEVVFKTGEDTTREWKRDEWVPQGHRSIWFLGVGANEWKGLSEHTCEVLSIRPATGQ